MCREIIMSGPRQLELWPEEVEMSCGNAHQLEFWANETETLNQAKHGDYYQLGEHRLLCGDSTNIGDVERLMDGVTGKILFTSPPYSDMRTYEGDKNLSADFLAGFIPAYRPFTDYQIVNLGLKRQDKEIVQYWDAYIEAARSCGYKLLAWNVWDKLDTGSIANQRAMFPLRHEWIFVFGVDSLKLVPTWEKKTHCSREHTTRRQRDGSMKYSSCGDTLGRYKPMESVVSIRNEKGPIRAQHPAVFPVALPGEFIRSMTARGDVVIDPFCGSGTTLIACEILGRRCYAMELEPRYVDVAISRWGSFTGRRARLVSSRASCEPCGAE